MQARGGFSAVTAHKQWRAVAASLGHDITKQTSASHAMRTNYTRCLGPWEDFMTGGGYEAARAAGTLPSQARHRRCALTPLPTPLRRSPPAARRRSRPSL